MPSLWVSVRTDTICSIKPATWRSRPWRSTTTPSGNWTPDTPGSTEKAAQIEKDAAARRRDAQRVEKAHDELTKRRDRLEKQMRQA